MCMPWPGDYITLPVSYSITLSQASSSRSDSVKKLVHVCCKFKKNMVPCPECGKHNHHSKLKCDNCGVCLHAHTIIILLCHCMGMW